MRAAATIAAATMIAAYSVAFASSGQLAMSNSFPAFGEIFSASALASGTEISPICSRSAIRLISPSASGEMSRPIKIFKPSKVQS